MTALRSAIRALVDEGDLTTATVEAAVGQIIDGEGSPVEAAAFLTALRCRGETADQLVGAARAMRARSLKIPCQRRPLLDTCGTGGDALHTFNISTATAFVAAAAGVPVAKHGNRSASSKSGSADVLEALGVRLDLSAEQVAQCVDEVGIGFCFAPRVHSAMKHVAPVRQALGFRTLFNLLGPLTNPAGAEFQVLGVGRVALAELMATALARLGVRRAFVVCGNNELDEVSLWGETAVFDVRGSEWTRSGWTPETLGLPACQVTDLRVESPQESAEIIRTVFAGKAGPARDMVLANATAALMAAEVANSPSQGVALARQALDSGAVQRLLESFVRRTHELAESGS